MKHATIGLFGCVMLLATSIGSAQDYAKQRALNQLQQARLQQLRTCETRGFNDYGLQQCRAAVDSWAEAQQLRIEEQDIAYKERQQRGEQQMRALQSLRDQLQETISPGSTGASGGLDPRDDDTSPSRSSPSSSRSGSSPSSYKCKCHGLPGCTCQ